jgi:hypothetical protein
MRKKARVAGRDEWTAHEVFFVDDFFRILGPAGLWVG